MKGEVDSLVNFPIDTSLKTIAHSALEELLAGIRIFLTRAEERRNCVF